MSYAHHFSRFLRSDPQRLHAAAHSHHPWPDVSFAAQQQAWLDAARMHDDKWAHIFDTVIPNAQRHVARRIGLPDASTVAFAPNTHELVVRLMSSLPAPARVLTTDGEFHSFARQLARWEEAGRVTADRVATMPLESFVERFAEAAATGSHDLVYVSQVFFDSGGVVDEVKEIVSAVPDGETLVVIDAYHGFMALPTDFGGLAHRAFYVAGGYKYAMAGEGVCFAHCPPGYALRPVDTGWLAGFGALERGVAGQVGYAADGSRLLGATFDPSGLYRFNAVQSWLDDIAVGVEDIHAHVDDLLQRLRAQTVGVLPEPDVPAGAHFLSVRMDDAAGAYQRLRAAGVVTDYRADRLRIGLGLYHDAGSVDELGLRIRAAV